MNGQISEATGQELWRINLKELKARTGMSSKQIADKEHLSEKAVHRFFSGETKSPSVDLVNSIIHALGGTWREIFGESGAVIGGQDFATLQAAVDTLKAECDALLAENAIQKAKIAAQHEQIDNLKDQIIETHNYYIKQKSIN